MKTRLTKKNILSDAMTRRVSLSALWDARGITGWPKNFDRRGIFFTNVEMSTHRRFSFQSWSEKELLRGATIEYASYPVAYPPADKTCWVFTLSPLCDLLEQKKKNRYGGVFRVWAHCSTPLQSQLAKEGQVSFSHCLKYAKSVVWFYPAFSSAWVASSNMPFPMLPEHVDVALKGKSLRCNKIHLVLRRKARMTLALSTDGSNFFCCELVTCVQFCFGSRGLKRYRLGSGLTPGVM